MRLEDVKVGLQVVTKPKLESTSGMTIKENHLAARAPSTEGVVRGYVPGHGGDVWWVEHPNNQVAAYVYTEFSPLSSASMPLKSKS